MQVCTRCIYDERIPNISFDEQGICNYCRESELLEEQYPVGERGWKILTEFAEKIRKAGRRKKYDVVVGVSGGCDSSYLLYLVKEKLGLRPLAVHFDNTWDSKIAVENIYRMTKKLDVDLYTHVVDNKEYNDVFKSFLMASVPEIDTPADIGLVTTLYMVASKFGIKYIMEGHSFRSEGISPQGWFYMDAKYIHGIQKRFGNCPIKTLPTLKLLRWLRWTILGGIKRIRPLWYLDYNKESTKKFLQEKFDWQWYGGHHMENRSAYFANNYYLPEKYEVDLRYCELSALIRSGQLGRKEALEQIKTEKPFDDKILEEVKKRLKFSDGEFEDVMSRPIKTFLDYETYKPIFERLKPLFYLMCMLNLAPRSFYIKYTRKYTEDELDTIRSIGTVPLPYHDKKQNQNGEPARETAAV